MFEVLHSAMQKDRVVFVKDAFFTFTEKEDVVTSTAFFSLNEPAALLAFARLRDIAKDKRIKLSLHEAAPEIEWLKNIPLFLTGSKGALQYWEDHDASGNA